MVQSVNHINYTNYNTVAKVKSNGSFDERRSNQSKYWMYETINEQLYKRFYQADGIEEMLARYEKEILAGKITSFAAAGKLLEFYDSEKNK